jgi:hypothetical protein
MGTTSADTSRKPRLTCVADGLDTRPGAASLHISAWSAPDGPRRSGPGFRRADKNPSGRTSGA